MSSTISCAEARAIDLVDYLLALGYTPQRIRGKEYWYLSPLRQENMPSFKVDRGRNIWYDHGLGVGGTLIDFGLQFHHCTLPSLLGILSGIKGESFSFHPPVVSSENVRQENEKRLTIVKSDPLQNLRLISYVVSRGVSLERAKKYLEQISYKVGEKEFMALGFRNDSGGYELRSPSFKGSSSPKDSTLIQGEKNGDTLAVFEGMFSFLSYLELKAKTPVSFEKNESHFLVLNTLSFFEKRRETMEIYPTINLYLDRDKAGVEVTQNALQWAEKFRDKSSLYKGYKDLNDYLVQSLKQSRPQEKRKSRGPKKFL